MPNKAKAPERLRVRGFFVSSVLDYERTWMKYTPKNQIKVDGKMSEQDAGVVGKRLANAATIAAIGMAIGSACAGLALVLKLFVQ